MDRAIDLAYALMFKPGGDKRPASERTGSASATLAFGHHEYRTPTRGYEPTRRDGGGTREELAKK